MAVRRWYAETAWVGGRFAERVLISVDGERVAGVEVGVARPGDAVLLAGLTLPGLANAHSHAFHRALRGRTQHGRGDFWTWREAMYALAARLDPDRMYRLARAVYAEMALAGVTAVGEFHYLHHGPGGKPYDDPNVMGGALIAAAAEAGIRLTLLDTCYLRGGFDQPLAGAQLRFGDGDAERWGQRADAVKDGPMLRAGAAIHSVRAVDPAGMEVVRAWAEARGAPLHLHLSEQRAENAACIAATGLTPTALAAEAGVLGDRTTAVHATHLTADDIAALGSSGTAVCLCATTERDLADGIGPSVALAQAGSRLCLGSDSHAVIDLFEEARAVELDERLSTQRRGNHPPDRLLEAMTGNGMRALGWEAGLHQGALADFITVDLTSPRTAGVPADGMVFAAAAPDVTAAVVGGEQVVADRRHTAVADVGAALSAAIGEVTG